MRWVYSVTGLLVVAWVALYLSSYGVLVSSEEVSAEQIRREAPQPSEAEARKMLDLSVFAARHGLSSVRRCTYFTGTGFKRVLCDPVKETVCPRLWSFDQ